MKNIRFAFAAAILAASSHLSVGQQPAPQSFAGSHVQSLRLVAGQQSLSFSDLEIPDPIVEAEITDFTASVSPSDMPQDSSEPASLPVSRGLVASPVERVIDQATLANVPHACDTPVMWNPHQSSLSPIARQLLKDQCGTARLWAGYEQQRCAECAAMWDCLSGKNGCRMCAAQAGQQSHSAPQQVNRYRSSGCDSCDALAAARSAETNHSVNTLVSELPKPMVVSNPMPEQPQRQASQPTPYPSQQQLPGTQQQRVGPVAVYPQPNHSPYSTVSTPYQVAR